MKLTKRILGALVLVSALPQFAIAAETKVAAIEAVVNKEVILDTDIASMKSELVKRYKENGQTLPDKENLDKQILDRLISDKVQLQLAERMGLRISDAQLEQTITEIAKKQNKTVAQMRAELEKSGGNYNAFVNSLRDELTINEVRQIQVRKRITISDSEVQRVVDRINQVGEEKTTFNFSHILIKVEENSPADVITAAEAKANKLVAQIKAGADIKKLAIANSDGPKALEGGDWGWRKIEEMPSLFADKIKESNKKGDIIGPFTSKLGVHIIQILDKQGSENVMTEEANVRHILIKPSIILSDEQAKGLLDKIRKDILAGTKTFDEMAKQYSQDPGSAVKGGELGWADPNVYVPEFRDVVQSQSAGQISQPFYTIHGWHILQVIAKRKSDTTESATKQKAYNLIYRQRFPAEAYAWLNELRQEAYIKINNPQYIIEE
jgi:peptidyl-prolyl cis-trans isomerase SurA